MFRWLKRKLEQQDKNKGISPRLRGGEISTDLAQNISYVKQTFTNSSDIEYREFYVGVNQEIAAFTVAVNALYDKQLVNNDLIRPLMSTDFQRAKGLDRISYLKNSIITISRLQERSLYTDAFRDLLSGDMLLFLDGYDQAIVLDTKKYTTRAVEEPQSESVVRGPREGFIEDLPTNLSLIRRRIINPKLKIEQMVLGKISQTDVAIVYLDGVTNPELITEVKARLQRINIDGLLDSGFVEELIEDTPFSIFPTIAYTEKPQVVVSRISLGRVAILVDGSPVALTVPHLFAEALHSTEDYNSRPYLATFIRVVRFSALFLTTFVPALYVAAVLFHNELIPTELMINIAAARETVPFPLFLEVIIFTMGFEFLKEAGIRMPKHVGQAVSIVGALILGEAAVNAGFAAAPTVIIIAVTSISGLMLPHFDELITVLRIVFLLAASFLGIYGMMLAFTVLLFHLAGTRSFGVPYMSPWFPLSIEGLGDFLLRFPLWAQKKRPNIFRSPNKTRMDDYQMPKPPKKQKEGGKTQK